MPQVVVLGAGLVGSVIAADLAAERGYQVTLADFSRDNLNAAAARSSARVDTILSDLADQESLGRLLQPFDLVLGALPGGLGFNALRTVIEAGKNCCDISFMPEDPLTLDALAKTKGVTAVVDCGVAPGLSHMLAACGAARLDDPQQLQIYVGGLPRKPTWPFNYKAGFSPADVIEEYVRESRLVENGRQVLRPALSGVEEFDFPGVGRLEAFNTDGLRSLLKTLKVPNMLEKTLRYPGHAELMRTFREIGLFQTEPLEVSGQHLSPRDFFSRLLFPAWQYTEGEQDLTAMRVVVAGGVGKTPKRYCWDLLDHYDAETKTSSMARTTAFPCAIVGRFLAQGKLARPGVLPPESLAADEKLFASLLSELKARGVGITETVT